MLTECQVEVCGAVADRAAKLGSTQNNYPGAGGCCCSTRTEYSLLDSLGRGHRTAAQWCYNNAAAAMLSPCVTRKCT